MAALTRSSVRSRIAEAITQALGPVGWTESRYHADLIGSEVRSIVHLSFAVNIGASTPAALDRQRRDVGAVAQTAVTVRWIHRLMMDPSRAQVADYDEALDAGEALVAAVLAVDKDPGLSVTLVRIGEHRAVGDGTYLRQDVEFTVLHRLALAA